MEAFSHILTRRINIGISACNFGCPVRYNKKGWDYLVHMGREQADFNWHPVCPETMSGMGVPREPIRLSGGDGYQVWDGEAKVKNKKGQDVTDMLKQGCISCLETLKRANVIAYVFMEGSPSCGVYRTSLKDKRLGTPPGLFGAMLMREGIFLIPSADLQSPVKWWDWRRRLLAFAWLVQQPLTSKQELYDVWHILKFLLQELDNVWARETGHTIANLPKKLDLKQMETLRQEMLMLLRKPSTLPRIKNSLWKHYCHFKKATGKHIESIPKPTTMLGVTALAKEILALERTSFEHGLLLGASPILYRDYRRMMNQKEKLEAEDGSPRPDE